MKTIRIVYILGIAYGLLYMVVTLCGIYDILSDKPFYRHLYIQDSSPHLQFHSITAMVLWLCAWLLFYAGFTWLNFRYKRRGGNKLLVLILFISLLIIIFSVREHYIFVQSGQDHYPGFDPYIL